MIPLKDDNPTHNTPYVTIGLIALNIVVHLAQLPMGLEERMVFIKTYGFVPARLFTGEGAFSPISPVATIFSSMFMHGGIMHLLGNMLYLWIFGNNIEDIMGPVRFIVFYLLCGIGAAMLQGVLDPDSLVPMVGASGAISGILGGYLIRFPRARVTVLLFLFVFIQVIQVRASVVLGFWIVFQLISGVGTLGAKGGGVAFFAHIGGFAAGLILVKLFERRRRRYGGRWAPFSG